MGCCSATARRGDGDEAFVAGLGTARPPSLPCSARHGGGGALEPSLTAIGEAEPGPPAAGRRAIICGERTIGDPARACGPRGARLRARGGLPLRMSVTASRPAGAADGGEVAPLVGGCWPLGTASPERRRPTRTRRIARRAGVAASWVPSPDPALGGGLGPRWARVPEARLGASHRRERFVDYLLCVVARSGLFRTSWTLGQVDAPQDSASVRLEGDGLWPRRAAGKPAPPRPAVWQQSGGG